MRPTWRSPCRSSMPSVPLVGNAVLWGGSGGVRPARLGQGWAWAPSRIPASATNPQAPASDVRTAAFERRRQVLGRAVQRRPACAWHWRAPLQLQGALLLNYCSASEGLLYEAGKVCRFALREDTLTGAHYQVRGPLRGQRRRRVGGRVAASRTALPAAPGSQACRPVTPMVTPSQGATYCGGRVLSGQRRGADGA